MKSKMTKWLLLVLISSGTAGIGCNDDAAAEHETDEDGGNGDAGDSGDGDFGDDTGEVDCNHPPDYGDCRPVADAYRPREVGCVDDGWSACISDDDTYHRIEESVSSIARSAAYDAIGAMLWENPVLPTADDFINARVQFEEEEGLGSRVARRYDVHYPTPTEGSCEDQGVPDAFPDYCVGPATLQPVIVDAFADGSLGNDPLVNAAKIEAALQWFFYVSVIKEATTCTDTAKDCDSSWAYYSGGTPRETPAGLAADIFQLAPATHDRAYDGILAVRCWRDLDFAEVATDLALRDRAITQLDQALIRGVSLLIRERFAALATADADHAAAIRAALRILVPLFDRETRARNAAAADLIASELAKEVADMDFAAVLLAIDTTYPC